MVASKQRRKQVYQSDLKSEMLFVVLLDVKRTDFLWSSNYKSTASFIHPRVLLTAGHNIYTKRTNVKSINIKLGCTANHKDSLLLEQNIVPVVNENIFVLESYNRHPRSSEDFGIIILPDSSLYKKAAGHFNLSSVDEQNTTFPSFLRWTGYPNPKDGIKLFTDQTAGFSLYNSMLKYDFYTGKGASGSPIYDASNRVFAVHTFGTKDGKGCNSATIITPPHLRTIKSWCLSKGITL